MLTPVYGTVVTVHVHRSQCLEALSITARCYGYATVTRLSVRPSVTFRYVFHTR